MQNIYRLPLVLEPQPEGGYTVTCPILPGLVTEADTMQEVMPNVADALAALLEVYEDTKQPLPEILQPVKANVPMWTETLVSLEAA